MFETRIYFSFENKKQLKSILKYINTFFDGYTLYKAIGFYKGMKEKSRIVELITPFELINVKNDISEYIKKIANQESILITTKNINMEFV